MDSEIQEMLDIASDKELDEISKYIKKLQKERKEAKEKEKNTPTLDEVMALMFEKYPNAKYFEIGMYAKSDEGELYSDDTGMFDFDMFFVDEENNYSDEDFASVLPDYRKAENWLNYYMMDGKKRDFDKHKKEEIPIKKSKGYPKINDACGRKLHNDEEMRIVYVKGKGIVRILDYEKRVELVKI